MTNQLVTPLAPGNLWRCRGGRTLAFDRGAADKKKKDIEERFKGGDFIDLTIQYGDFMEC